MKTNMNSNQKTVKWNKAEETEANRFHLCLVCQGSYEITEFSECSICNSLVCDECTDISYEEQWDEILCDSCSEEYAQFIRDERKPHYCFNKCGCKINFFHAMANALEKMSDANFLKLWGSEYVQFYCCDCYYYLKKELKNF